MFQKEEDDKENFGTGHENHARTYLSKSALFYDMKLTPNCRPLCSSSITRKICFLVVLLDTSHIFLMTFINSASILHVYGTLLMQVPIALDCLVTPLKGNYHDFF